MVTQGGVWFGDDPDSLKESVSKGTYHLTIINPNSRKA